MSAAPKTEQQSQIEKWHQDCQHIEGLVNSCPALTDADMLHEWYQEVHGWFAYISHAHAQSESLYAVVVAKTLESAAVSETAWGYIKGSSTMLNQYLIGKHSEEYMIWQRIKNLNRNLETILNDMRTQVVSLRDAERRDNMTSQNQRQPQPTQNKNPAINRNEDVGWPKEQSMK